MPGVPIFHSTDLVNWTQIGYVLDRPSQLNLAGSNYSGGIFTPAIRYYNGVFYAITANMTYGSNFIVYTENPANPILTHRHLGKIYPITNIGHGDLIQTPQGNWYMAVLGCRPCRSSVNLGRETFIPDVIWVDEWPVVTPRKGWLVFRRANFWPSFPYFCRLR